MNGVLVVDKPAGPSSHDVVARVRRATGIRRIGHTGTLDPRATGVLPLVLGRATRLAQFMTAADKEYVAEVRFGFATTTYDAEGEPLPPHPGDHQPVPGDLRAALAPILACASYDQVPPPFSAKKIAGTPAYKLARRNKPVALRSVRVTIREIDLLGSSAETATIRLVCSAGFYVRTFAHELGQRLGCGAHLATLRRTRSGEFGIEQAVPLEAVEQDAGAASRHLLALDLLLPSLPAVVLTEQGAKRAAHGNSVEAADVAPRAPSDVRHVRMVDGSGRLLGIARPGSDGSLQPLVVVV